jgi:hypothetical protein
MAGDIVPPKTYALTPGGVNASDGSFVHLVTDLSIGPMKVERFHRTGVFEPDQHTAIERWRDNHDIYVSAAYVYTQWGGGWHYRPIVHIGNSASGAYTQSSSTLSSISSNNYDADSVKLEWSGTNSWSGGHYVYTDKTGTIYTFSSTVSAVGQSTNAHSQKVSRIDFPDGRIQTFTYSGNSLKMVEDSSGYAIVYDGATVCGFNRAITYVTSSSACTGAPLKVTYIESAGSFQVVDVDGKTTSYTMGAEGATCIKPSGYTSCKISNEYANYGYGRIFVKRQTLADGSVWTISRSDNTTLVGDPESSVPYDGHNEVFITDPAGKETWLTFTKSSLYSMRDPNGRWTSYRFVGAVLNDIPNSPYTYDGTMLIEATSVEGNKYVAAYNGPFNSITKLTQTAKPGSGLSDLVEEFGYGSCSTGGGTRQNCAKPIWMKDAKGNQTDFTYASHGGMLSEMKPAPSVGAARPLKLTTWVQKYAYIKNSSGNLVAAPTPVWVMATETQCQTVAGSSSPACDGAAPMRIATYEYGANGTANNLLVRGVVVTADGQSRRTCFGYDTLGRKVSETTPNANLASCP